MNRSLLAIAFAVGLLILGGAPAWAGSSSTPDVGWTYNFTPGQNFVSADSPGSGTVAFTNEPTKSATNSSDVVVTNLRVSSTASPDTPDSLNSNGAWSVGLKLTDTATGATDTMNFTGKLGGSFSSSNSNITDTFTGQTSYTWTAGTNGNVYTVSLVGYTPPGPPTASNAGSISAFVQVTPSNGGGIISKTPEPSTLVLSCLGVGVASLVSWRKRRRSLAAMLA